MAAEADPRPASLCWLDKPAGYPMHATIDPGMRPRGWL